MRKAILAVALLFVWLGIRPVVGHSMTIVSSRDCDANAVIRCGALDFSELKNRSQNADVQAIFAHFGITPADIDNIDSLAVVGSVAKSGQVIVNGKVVATSAMTAGRQNIPGSTVAANDGATFYVRPPSVSFVSSPLQAFVVMNNNTFIYAIIASCGNPVVATPVKTPVKHAAVVPSRVIPATPTKPSSSKTTVITTPAPKPSQSQNQTQSQTQSQSQTVNVTTPTVTTPPATPSTVSPPPESITPTVTTTTPAIVHAPVVYTQPVAAAPVTQPVATYAPAQTIPNTGPGNVMAISGFTTIFATLGHWFYQRRKII